MPDGFVTYRDFCEHLVNTEKSIDKLWTAVIKNQMQMDNLIKLQLWFAGITSSILVGLILFLINRA